MLYSAVMNAMLHPMRADTSQPGRINVAEFIEMMPAFDIIDAWMELDNGTIVRMNPPHYPHLRVQRLLAKAIEALLPSDSALITDKEVGVRIGSAVVRTIDIAVFKDPGDEPNLVDGQLVLLAVEISDTSLIYDLGIKSLDYARAGILDYWVVDFRARAIHLFSDPTTDGYQSRSVAIFGQPMHAACLPEPVIFES